MVSTTKMTARQFLELGEDPPGIRLELVNGEVAVSPSPTPDHSFTVNMLSFFLTQHIRANKLGRLFGDVDTIFGPYDVRRPDLIYFSTARVHLIGKKAMEGPPDLCVEIISPDTETMDRKEKFKQYAKGGVAYYWIVDPEAKTIEAFELARGKYRAAGGGKGRQTIELPPFEGLELPLSELWQPR
jgi:Uma2 family endonuclease